MEDGKVKEVSTKEVLAALEYGAKMFRVFSFGKEQAQLVMAIEEKERSLSRSIKKLATREEAATAKLAIVNESLDKEVLRLEEITAKADVEYNVIISAAKEEKKKIVADKEKQLDALEVSITDKAVELSSLAKKKSDAEAEFEEITAKIKALKGTIGGL